MLKLIYHTAAFGPIELEYHRPIIRVGRSEDNDLVLRHPSVEPHHCFLLFRGEKVLCLPPSEALPSPQEVPHLTGQEFGSGDSLWIGELQFTLAHSSSSVALHTAREENSMIEARNGKMGIGPAAGLRRFFCPQCRTFVAEAEVKQMGLVGQAKRNLCPKCSRVLEMEPIAEKTQRESEKQVARKGLRRVIGNYQARLLGRDPG